MKLLDESTITFVLIRFTCQTQLHLLLIDWPEQCKEFKKSPFIIKVRKEEPNRMERSPVVQGQHTLELEVGQILGKEEKDRETHRKTNRDKQREL